MFDHPFSICSTLNIRYPFRVVQVPLHCLADARLEDLGRFPAQFAFDLARADGVATVMAGAIGHVGDLLGVRLAIGTGEQLVEQLAMRS